VAFVDLAERSSEDIISALHSFAPRRRSIASIDSWLKTWIGNTSHPKLVQLANQEHYVVKGPWIDSPGKYGKLATNDNIVGRLGNRLFPDVFPRVELVHLTEATREAYKELQEFLPGFCHASRFVENTSEATCVQHTDILENRDRFAKIVTLFGWCRVEDHQFIYDLSTDFAYAVDNGNAFGNGESWTIEDLEQSRRCPQDAVCRQFEEKSTPLSRDELCSAVALLAGLSFSELVDCIASPPLEWGVGLEQRVALAKWLWAGRQELLEDFEGL
jgi:hypothetical protein